MVLIRPALGLTQGLIIYCLHSRLNLSLPLLAGTLVLITFPLFAMQIKLSSLKALPLGLSWLLAMGLIYGYSAYSLTAHAIFSENYLYPILGTHCLLSAFILFIFYCVAVEEGKLSFPYACLFSEFWQVIIKLFLGGILVILTWGLFFLAGNLFEQVNIVVIENIISSNAFHLIMPPLFFGIAMAILHEYEQVMTKFRDILLAFCKFLYPIYVVICLSFLWVVPFAARSFENYWGIVVFLNLLNVILFNGIYQGGQAKKPYVKWFRGIIYVLLLTLTLYSIYIIRYPALEIRQYGLKPLEFLLLIGLSIIALYNIGYSLSVFVSRPSTWLNFVKTVNIATALLIALIYLLLALPWLDIGKISTQIQTRRVLGNLEISNPNQPYFNPGYLVAAKLQNADLENKSLFHAELSRANLQGANLSGVDLSEANLTRANLNQANLSHAKLDKAILKHTKFKGAKLINVSFENTLFEEVDLTGADLGQAINLEQTQLNGACGNNVTLPIGLNIKPCQK